MITVKEFINYARYDRDGQIIWAVDRENGHQMLLSVRGWGGIQQHFKGRKGEIDTKAAGRFQDEMGRFIADAINEKLDAQQLAELAALSKDELGDFVDWVTDMRFKKYAEGWCEAGGSNGWHCTTDELLKMFRDRKNP